MKSRTVLMETDRFGTGAGKPGQILFKLTAEDSLSPPHCTTLLAAMGATVAVAAILVAFARPLPPTAGVFASLSPLAAIAAAVTAAAMARWRGGRVVEESLLVVPGLGLQLAATSASGGVSRHFVDADRLRDVVINEGFVAGGRVVFYLALIVEGEERLLLPFRHLCPRLPVLAEICRAARGALGLDADPAADGGSGLALACG